MRYALTGIEKCLVWRTTVFPYSAQPWRVSIGINGGPLSTPVWFATWREAMDYATGDR